jgi:hypothetical protein
VKFQPIWRCVPSNVYGHFWDLLTHTSNQIYGSQQFMFVPCVHTMRNTLSKKTFIAWCKNFKHHVCPHFEVSTDHMNEHLIWILALISKYLTPTSHHDVLYLQTLSTLPGMCWPNERAFDLDTCHYFKVSYSDLSSWCTVSSISFHFDDVACL